MPEKPEPAPPAAEPALPPEVVALAQNGAAISMAARDADGRPVVGLGVGCRLRPDGRMRILLSEPANLRLLAAIEAGSALAVTFVSTRAFGAFQVKAGSAARCPASPDDLPELDRQVALASDGLVEIGFNRTQAAGYTAFVAGELTAIELRPERVFLQTPGPGAGTEIAR
ncbi:hypothetical protein [Amaricoccus solimangrovi]|uniref:Pyridoxamine 5'-phosphate oxidase putative domain-containing protein n=1 Tax=Amaricoccus solimangrovi TaxID=2589815 RepID=A0A501WJH9_9RHOB|nr:hypothetical protein [Amaricoccus solimangrovi]TPE48284.1 hypothetical protein FJM51_18005 [Amaricoccus solimangrovi]